VGKRLIRYLLIMLPVLGLGVIVNPGPAAAIWDTSCHTSGGNPEITYIHGVAAWWIPPNSWFYTGGQDYCEIGKSRLLMQADGNLVLYDENLHARWATGKLCSSGGSYCNNATFQADGNWVVYRGTVSSAPVVWASNTCCHTLGTWSLYIQADGNIVIYDEKLVARWATNTNH